MRARAFLGAAIGVTGFIVGCGLAVWLVLWVSLQSSAARVPSVVGLDPSQAVARLQGTGLLARLQEGVFSDAVPVGRIAEQQPSAGFELKRGATVVLHASLGNAAQKVSNVVGLPLSLAEAQLQSDGLGIARRCEVAEQADAVVVLASTPPAGAMVPAGSSVSILVNRIPRQRLFVMPELVGRDESAAAAAVRRHGFRLAALQRVAYPGIRPGVVLRQDPSAGGPVAEAAVVALWVSR
jgi:beta-lactam-binding protein with PASTA domain